MWSRRAPAGRHRTTVSHGATNDPGRRTPARREPDAASTSIVPSRCTVKRRTPWGPSWKAVRRAASSPSAHASEPSATRSGHESGNSDATATVAAAATAVNARAARLYWSSIRTVSFFMTSWLSFLASRGAHTGAAGVAHFGDPRAELAAARDGTIVADISHNALVAISGDDARAFLHGQFTNDVEALERGAAQWNGWCSAKGRLLATFLLVRHGGEYLVLLPAGIAPAFTKRLSMFVLRSRVKIADAGERFVRIGFAGERAAAAVARHWGRTPGPMTSVESELGLVVALDERRFVVLATPERAPDVWNLLAGDATPAGAEAWDWLGMQAGIPTIVAATQDAFVPQMANFDLVGGVSFRKGCYPGQEIVARMQYRGILKRRMAMGHVDAPRPPMPGDSVYSASFGEQAAGTVVQATRSPEGGYDLQVVAQVESLAARDLALGAPGGPPIEVRDFPALATAS